MLLKIKTAELDCLVPLPKFQNTSCSGTMPESAKHFLHAQAKSNQRAFGVYKYALLITELCIMGTSSTIPVKIGCIEPVKLKLSYLSNSMRQHLAIRE
jgi:hypothetical protein